MALLTERHGLGRLKISSGDLTNGPLLLAAARSGAAIILSTGMSTLGEVETALGVLAFGMTAPRQRPAGAAAFAAAYGSAAGQQALADRVTLLHCTSRYPAPAASVNLRAMTTLSEAFGLRAGYSDHTLGSRGRHRRCGARRDGDREALHPRPDAAGAGPQGLARARRAC